MGLVPQVAPHVGSRYGYLAGTDEQRAADINAMFADPAIRAVFAMRGGWGCARLLPFLDWDTIRANPKLLVGFSDVTALHLAFAARAGFPTIHAIERGGHLAGDQLGKPVAARLRRRHADCSRRRAVTDPDPLAQERWRTAAIRPGKARGRLLGGNLSVLAALVGTPWLPDFDGAILFLEDVGEAEYRIDRMLSQLALAGILGKVAGGGVRPVHALHRRGARLHRLHRAGPARAVSRAARGCRRSAGPTSAMSGTS